MRCNYFPFQNKCEICLPIKLYYNFKLDDNDQPIMMQEVCSSRYPRSKPTMLTTHNSTSFMTLTIWLILHKFKGFEIYKYFNFCVSSFWSQDEILDFLPFTGSTSPSALYCFSLPSISVNFGKNKPSITFAEQMLKLHRLRWK